MSLFRVVPDGVLIDHVAEFSYEKKNHIPALFRRGPVEYTDTVAKFVQTLATSNKLLGANPPELRL